MKRFFLSLLILQVPLQLIFGQTKDFVIGSYGCPPADEQAYIEAKELGLNTLIANNPENLNPWQECDYAELDKYRKEILKLAGKHEIKVILDDSWIQDGTHDAFQVKSYSDLKAFTGMALPPIEGRKDGNGWTIAKAGGAILTVKRKFGNRDYIVELLPAYANATEIGDYKKGNATENYKAYVEEVCTKAPCNILSWYFMPKTTGTGDKGSMATEIDLEDYLENLNIVAAAAEKSGKDFWTYLPATAHHEMKYAPNLTMIKAMAGLSLCYGAKGLLYHSYQQPCGEKTVNSDFYGPFMLMAKVRNRNYWYPLKQINQGLAYLGPHFMKSIRLQTTQHTDNLKEYKICMDSCDLLEIVEYDTSYTEFEDSVGVIVNDEYDECNIDSTYKIVNPTRVYDVETEEMKDTVEILFGYKVICQRIARFDVSKNVLLNSSGNNPQLVTSVFDYGNGSRMLCVHNYNCKEKSALSVDFGDYYQVLDLQYQDRKFAKCDQNYAFDIEAGESRIFILKPKQ